MAGLYDKIRKKKKQNLENIYKDLSAPKSMAESVAKFKNVDSSAAYSNPTTIDAAKALEPDKAATAGMEAKKDEKKCKPDPSGEHQFGIDESTGQPCPDPAEKANIFSALGFGKGKGKDGDGPEGGDGGDGGSGIEKSRTAFLKSIVGERGILKIIESSPFKDEHGDDEEDPNASLGNNNNEGAGTSAGTVVINNQAKTVSGSLGEQEDIDIQDPKKKVFKDACSEEYIKENGPEACDKWKKENDRCGKLIAQGASPEALKAAGCGGFDPINQVEDCAATYGEGYTFNRATGKCEKVTKGSDDNIQLQGRTIEGQDPMEMSENDDFIGSWFAAGGQKHSQGQARRQEGRDFKEDYKKLDKGQRNLYNETKKWLRKNDKLPKGSANIREAVFNAMNDYEKSQFLAGGGEEKDYVPSGNYGKKIRITDIARRIRGGEATYKDIARAGEYEGRILSDEDLEKIRNITDDYQGNDVYQKEDSYKTIDPGDGTEMKFDTEADFRAWIQTPAGKEWLKNNPNVSSSQKNYTTRYAPPTMKTYMPAAPKKHGFAMKRGKLGRPGYN